MAQPRIAHFKIDWGLYPNADEGPRTIRIFADVPAVDEVTLNLGTELDREWLSNVQTIKIDNSTGLNPITVRTATTRDKLVVPSGSQAYLPFLLGDDTNIVLSRIDPGTVHLNLINMPMPAVIWSTSASGEIVTISGTVATSTVDGANVTQGTTTDAPAAAPATVAPATVIALLKAILNKAAGGGAVTIADGADIAQGSTTDAAITNPATVGTLSSVLRGVLTFVSRIPALGQALMAASLPVTVSSDQSAIAVKAAAAAFSDGSDSTIGLTTSAAVTNPATNATLMAYIRGLLTQATAIIAQLPATLGQKVMANAFAVSIASDQSSVGVVQDGGATGTLTVTAFTAASATVAAANAARKGGALYNNSVNIAYVRLGAAVASAANFTIAVAASAYYELPYNYRGEVRIFSGVATGSWNWTELT